jgi:hypothetical protein
MAQNSKPPSLVERHCRNMRWARNNICWAIAIKAEIEGRPLQAIGDVEAAQAQAFEIASLLWLEAGEDSESDLPPSSARFNFIRKVTDWCENEIGYTPAL